jgi:hypothetical protein
MVFASHAIWKQSLRVLRTKRDPQANNIKHIATSAELKLLKYDFENTRCSGTWLYSRLR